MLGCHLEAETCGRGPGGKEGQAEAGLRYHTWGMMSFSVLGLIVKADCGDRSRIPGIEGLCYPKHSKNFRTTHS